MFFNGSAHSFNLWYRYKAGKQCPTARPVRRAAAHPGSTSKGQLRLPQSRCITRTAEVTQATHSAQLPQACDSNRAQRSKLQLLLDTRS